MVMRSPVQAAIGPDSFNKPIEPVMGSEQGPQPGTGDAILLEDNVSFLLLEDNTSKILLES